MTEGYYLQQNTVPDSVVRIELITHFHRNPGLESTAMEMADCIGRHKDQVECQMRKLVQLRILEEQLVGEEMIYRYIPPFSISMFNKKGKSGIESRKMGPEKNKEATTADNS
jgi:hypothetical protein